MTGQIQYTLGTPESIQLFKEGLSYPILADIMRAPMVSMLCPECIEVIAFDEF
jgi:hypothetical protein